MSGVVKVRRLRTELLIVIVRGKFSFSLSVLGVTSWGMKPRVRVRPLSVELNSDGGLKLVILLLCRLCFGVSSFPSSNESEMQLIVPNQT